MAGYKYPEVSIVNSVYNVTRMFEADNDGQYWTWLFCPKPRYESINL